MAALAFHNDLHCSERLKPLMRTSGGVWEEERGYCLMIGGDASWLFDLTAEALLKSADLKDYTGRLSDFGDC